MSMQPTLYGLQVDYVTQNGHFMVLTGPQDLGKEELSAFQVTMLLSNKIPRLLELQVMELDQTVKLYYNITGKRKLNYWLRSGSISIKQMFQLLYSIVEVLSESGTYMLQDSRYVLKEEYIYCGEQLTDLYLTYVPKEVLTEKNAVSVDLQHLLSRLVHKVSELQGNGYQEVMNYLMDESFNLPTLKGLLMKHIMRLGTEPSSVEDLQPQDQVAESTLKPPFLGTSGANLMPSEPNFRNDSAPNHLNENRVSATVNYTSPERVGSSSFSLSGSGASMAMAAPFATYSLDEIDTGTADPSDDSRKKLQLPVILIGVLMICLVWKLYLDYRGEAWATLCSGLTLLIADLVFILLRIWKPSKSMSQPRPSIIMEEMALGMEGMRTNEERPEQPFPRGWIDSEGRNTEVTGEVQPDSRLEFRLDNQRGYSGYNMEKKEETVDSPSHLTDKDMNYYNQLEHRTMLLRPRDVTVLLKSTAPTIKSVPFLEWKRQDSVQRIPLTKASLVIGRGGTEVDLEHEETGVSRMHMEIVKGDEGFAAKDLGSRNGTYLNGQLLVPYRMYSLKEGDIVKIVNTEFIFKMGL